MILNIVNVIVHVVSYVKLVCLLKLSNSCNV